MAPKQENAGGGRSVFVSLTGPRVYAVIHRYNSYGEIPVDRRMPAGVQLSERWIDRMLPDSSLPAPAEAPAFLRISRLRAKPDRAGGPSWTMWSTTSTGMNRS